MFTEQPKQPAEGQDIIDPTEIASVPIRLPTFLNQSPATWFLQEKSCFSIAGIRTQLFKYQLP